MRKIKLAKVANGGFTLVELLLVVAILAVIASLAVGVLGEAQNDASIAATRSRITVIQQILEAELEEYEIRRPPIRSNVIEGLVAASETAGVLAPNRRLIHVRNIRRMIIADLIRTELPDGSLVNVPNGSTEAQYVGQFPSDVLRNYMGLVGIEETLIDQVFLPAVTPPRVRRWAAWNPGSNGWQFTEDAVNDNTFEDAASRSELLFEILSRIDVDGIPAIEQLSSTAIGDTNNNGFNEVLDAWGEPMFLQWQQEWLFPTPFDGELADLNAGVWEEPLNGTLLGGLSFEHPTFLNEIFNDSVIPSSNVPANYAKPVLPTQIRPFLTSARLLEIDGPPVDAAAGPSIQRIAP